MAINLSITSAIQFSLETPSEIDQYQEFTATIISNDTNDSYDVKIFVEDPNSSPKTISQTYNEGWQSSYYYVKESFPKQTEFDLKINKPGNWEICARLRKSSPSKPICNEIEVIEQEQEDTNNTNNNQNILSQNKQNSSKPRNNNNPPTEQSQYNTNFPQYQNTKLILNNNDQETIITKKQKTRSWILYSFTTFTVIIIILLALRKL